MFYISFMVVIFFGIGVRKSEIRNKYFCIITGIMYFALAAFRGASVGTDTPHYINNLINLAGLPLERVAMIYKKDICFYWFLSILGRYTNNYTILLIIVACWFGYSVWHFINKYSPDPALSIIVLLALSIYQFSLTGIRQTIAMGFLVWAFDMIIQKKNLKAVVLILIGSLFHASLMVSLILIPINILVKKVTRRGALIICGLLVVVFLMRSYIAKYLIVLIADRDYSITEANSGLTMTFVIFALLVMTSVFMEEFSARNENASFFFLTGAVACAFQMLVATQAIFFRLAFYFLMVYPIMIPSFVSTLQNRNNYRIMTYVLYVLMSVQYLFFTMNSCGIAPYHFFWQD